MVLLQQDNSRILLKEFKTLKEGFNSIRELLGYKDYGFFQISMDRRYWETIFNEGYLGFYECAECHCVIDSAYPLCLNCCIENGLDLFQDLIPFYNEHYNSSKFLTIKTL